MTRLRSSAEPDEQTVGAGPTLSLFGGRGRLLALLAAVLLVLWLGRGIVGPFVIAAVLAYAFSPVVSAVEAKTRAPRVLVIALGYALVLGIAAVLAAIAARQAGSEIQILTSGGKSGEDIIESALQKLFGDSVVIAGVTYNVKDLADQIRSSLLGVIRTPSDAFHMAEAAVEVALHAILTLIVTFYFLLDGRRFGQFAIRFLDPSQRADATRIARRIHIVLGRWLRGQLLLIGLVAAVLYVSLGPILHVPYALAIAILSGVLEIVPLVGPVIAASLAGTVAFATRGSDTTIVVLVVYVVLRQVEDQVIMPVVIGRAVHLHPVVTIFAVLVGLSVFGVLGGLLAVPVAAALNVTLHELYPDEMATEPRPPARRSIGAPLRRMGAAPFKSLRKGPMAAPAAPSGPAPAAAPAAPSGPAPAAAPAGPAPMAAPAAELEPPSGTDAPGSTEPPSGTDAPGSTEPPRGTEP